MEDLLGVSPKAFSCKKTFIFIKSGWHITRKEAEDY